MSNKVNPYGSAPTHHMLSVLVQNRPGVLARVASLFARRGYNIYSLAVAPTEQDDFSRITIVVDVCVFFTYKVMAVLICFLSFHDIPHRSE